MKPRTITHTQHPQLKPTFTRNGDTERNSHCLDDHPHLCLTLVHLTKYPISGGMESGFRPHTALNSLPFLMNKSSIPSAKKLLQPPSLVSAYLLFLPSPTSTSQAKKMAAPHPPDRTQSPADLVSKEHIIHNIVINHGCIIHQGRDLATGPALFDPFEQENESIHGAEESKKQS